MSEPYTPGPSREGANRSRTKAPAELIGLGIMLAITIAGMAIKVVVLGGAGQS